MGLNVSKGNMYDFVTHTWNTIKGECPHGCSYCYMHRWGKQKPVRFDKGELKTDLGEGNFIFVGSSCDMFAGAIPVSWIRQTLARCMDFDNRYLFQSKRPCGMVGEDLPPRSSICTTIETNRVYKSIMNNAYEPEDRATPFEWARKTKPTIPRYVTIEPIMDFDLTPMVELIKRCEPVQVNIGADSGNNGLPEPRADKVLALIYELQKFTTIARKSNLGRLLKNKVD